MFLGALLLLFSTSIRGVLSHNKDDTQWGGPSLQTEGSPSVIVTGASSEPLSGCIAVMVILTTTIDVAPTPPAPHAGTHPPPPRADPSPSYRPVDTVPPPSLRNPARPPPMVPMSRAWPPPPPTPNSNTKLPPDSPET